MIDTQAPFLALTEWCGPTQRCKLTHLANASDTTASSQVSQGGSIWTLPPRLLDWQLGTGADSEQGSVE
eukprot:scaffold139741_cov21-Tisochrysis_lutea.AAC.1